MADQSTVISTFQCPDRVRIRTDHAEAFTNLAAEMDQIHAWGLLADFPLTVYGWDVTFSAGQNFSIALGEGVIGGKVAKTTGATNLPITAGDATNPRIDNVEILPAGLSTQSGGSATEVTLSIIARTAVAAEAVGVADGLTSAWDLDFAGVDGRTLKVQVGGTAVGGWNLSPGTGGGSVDQIIFGTPPVAGNITADYTYQTGGKETAGAHNMRYEQTVAFTITQGAAAPSPSAPAWNAGAIRIAQISVPAGWAGGATATADNTVKQFTVYPTADAESDLDGSGSPNAYTPAESPNCNKLIHPVRSMDQVIHGCRIQYVDATNIKITPGWGVLGGISWRNRQVLTVTFDAGDLPAAGWFYVYGEVNATSSTSPSGQEFSQILVYDTPPNAFGRVPSGVDTRLVYLGAVYATAAATMRAFYTHGDWIYWELPLDLFPGAPGAQGDIDVSAWCPATGRLLNVMAKVEHNESATVGAFTRLRVHSHQYDGGAEARIYPMVRAEVSAPKTGTAFYNEGAGPVRVEENGGTYYIHYHQSSSGTPTTSVQEIFIQGYLDDYRTMDYDGTVPFY